MTLEIKLFALLAIVAALLFGLNRFVASERAAGQAQCRADQAKADQIELARVTKAQQEVNIEAQRMLSRRQDEAINLSAASDRLRARVATAINSGASAPAECKTTPEATRVCAELLSKADERLRILAATADASYDAGISCERSYDALTK